MKLANILTRIWMQSRKPEELEVMYHKLTKALGDVMDDICLLANNEKLSKAETKRLDDLRDERTHLGQVVEDLDRVLGDRAGRSLAA